MPPTDRPVRLALALALLLAGMDFHPRVAVAAPPPLDLEAAQRLALARNPELRGVALEVEAATARLDGASLLLPDNPELNLAIGPRTVPVEVNYSLSLVQPLEIAGQRGARIDGARAQVRVRQAHLAGRRAALRAQVREAFGAALAAQARLDLAARAVALAQQALAAAQERYRAGAASRIDVNLAHVEVGRTTRDQATARQQVAAALGRLVLLLGLDRPGELLLDGSLEALPRSTSPEGADLRAVVEGRPEVVAARGELDAARADERLASRQAVPNLQIGVATSREEGADVFQGLVGMALPLFNRNQAGRGLAKIRTALAELTLAAARRCAEQEIHLAIARLDGARGAARALSGEVLQAAEANVELVSEGYRAGKIELLQLLLIRREALAARRAHLDALEELNAAGAELERVLAR